MFTKEENKIQLNATFISNMHQQDILTNLEDLSIKELESLKAIREKTEKRLANSFYASENSASDKDPYTKIQILLADEYKFDQLIFDLDSLTEKVAAQSHQHWQTVWRKQNGQKPRIKQTADLEWIKLNKTDRVDIGLTEYSRLPIEWQKENQLSVQAAYQALKEQVLIGVLPVTMPVLYKPVELDIEDIYGAKDFQWAEHNLKKVQRTVDQTKIDVEQAASRVHDIFVQRHVNNDWVLDDELCKPYSELSEAEKEKDRIFIRLLLENCKFQSVEGLPLKAENNIIRHIKTTAAIRKILIRQKYA